MNKKDLTSDFEEQYNELIQEEEHEFKKHRYVLITISSLVLIIMSICSIILYYNYKQARKAPEVIEKTVYKYSNITYKNGTQISNNVEEFKFSIENIGDDKFTYTLRLYNIINNSEQIKVLILQNDKSFKEFTLNENEIIDKEIVLNAKNTHEYEIKIEYLTEEKIEFSASVIIELDK